MRKIFFILFTLILVISYSNVLAENSSIDTTKENRAVGELEEIKKLMPNDVILVSFHGPTDYQSYINDTFEDLMTQYKIGNEVSHILTAKLYDTMGKIYEHPDKTDWSSFLAFTLKCAKEIKGYYLGLDLTLSGYTVIVEYELIDPSNDNVICSNKFNNNYGWVIQGWSDTAMIKSSLKKVVKDLYEQLQVKNPELIKL